MKRIGLLSCMLLAGSLLMLKAVLLQAVKSMFLLKKVPVLGAGIALMALYSWKMW